VGTAFKTIASDFHGEGRLCPCLDLELAVADRIDRKTIESLFYLCRAIRSAWILTCFGVTFLRSKRWRFPRASRSRLLRPRRTQLTASRAIVERMSIEGFFMS
jgi:hypothetical protein